MKLLNNRLTILSLITIASVSALAPCWYTPSSQVCHPSISGTCTNGCYFEYITTQSYCDWRDDANGKLGYANCTDVPTPVIIRAKRGNCQMTQWGTNACNVAGVDEEVVGTTNCNVASPSGDCPPSG